MREGQQDQTGENSRLGGRSFLNGTEKNIQEQEDQNRQDGMPGRYGVQPPQEVVEDTFGQFRDHKKERSVNLINNQNLIGDGGLAGQQVVQVNPSFREVFGAVIINSVAGKNEKSGQKIDAGYD